MPSTYPPPFPFDVDGLTVAVTGHRPDSLDSDWSCTSALWDAIREWFRQLANEQRPACLISGMALGVDQIAAAVAVEHDIPVCAAVPFAGQERRWPPHTQTRYWELLDQAAAVVVINDGGYAPWKMYTRNRWMVDHADRLWAVWNGSTGGGTGGCVTYAQSKQVPADRFDPRNFQPPTVNPSLDR